MQNLIEIFDSLKKPESTKGILSFTAVQLESTTHRIGKDSCGWPALLLKSSSEQRGAQIRLEHLDIQHFIRCRITNTDGSSEEGRYSVIRCTEADNELAHYFLYMITPILKLLGRTPTFSEISRVIAYLVELFHALTQPPIKSVSGLWAELFVIQNSDDIKVLTGAWHATPEEKYDFSSGSQRIEVKSTSQRDRTHHFSLEQLIPPIGCKVVVASLFVERNGGGTSVSDLLEEIKGNLMDEPDLQERLNRVTALTLGKTLREGYASCFDRELALESLQFFNATDVPKIVEPLPKEISDVHFKSDLSKCKNLSNQELLNAGGIFACSFHRK